MKTRIQLQEFKNASSFKYNNARVLIMSLDNNEFAIELKILSNDHSVRAIHKVIDNKIVLTGIRISENAAFCIMEGLKIELKKNRLKEKQNEN